MLTTRFFSDISNKFDLILSAWETLPGVLITALTGILLVCLTLYILYLCYGLIFGQEASVMDVFYKVFKTWFILALCFFSSVYGPLIHGLFNSFLLELSQAFPLPYDSDLPVLDSIGQYANGLINQTAGQQVFAYMTYFDKIMSNAISGYVFKIWPYASQHISINAAPYMDYSGIPPMFGGFFTLMMITIYCVVGAVHLLVLQFSVAFLIAVGPLFILALAFPGTRGFFNPWLSSLLKYVFVSIIVTFILRIGASTVYGYALVMSDYNPLSVNMIVASVQVFAVVTMLSLLIYKLVEFASNLSSGLAFKANTAIVKAVAGPNYIRPDNSSAVNQYRDSSISNNYSSSNSEVTRAVSMAIAGRSTPQRSAPAPNRPITRVSDAHSN